MLRSWASRWLWQRCHGVKSDATAVGSTQHAPKVRWSFPVWGAVEVVFAVLTAGAEVHPDPPGTMEALEVSPDLHWDAAHRHLVAWRLGQRRDPQTGLPTLGHAAARVLLLLASEMRNGGE